MKTIGRRVSASAGASMRVAVTGAVAIGSSGEKKATFERVYELVNVFLIKRHSCCCRTSPASPPPRRGFSLFPGLSCCRASPRRNEPEAGFLASRCLLLLPEARRATYRRLRRAHV